MAYQIVLVLSLLVAGNGALSQTPPANAFKTSILGIALGYSTREICSCVFVENRSEADCNDDFKPPTVPVSITIDRTIHQVSGVVSIPSRNISMERITQFDGSSCVLK